MLLTAHGSIEDQLALINKGAFGVVSKPYNDKDFLLRVTRAAPPQRHAARVRDLRLRLSREGHDLIVEDGLMRRLLDHVATVAATDPVLLTGESGVGKRWSRGTSIGRSSRQGPFSSPSTVPPFRASSSRASSSATRARLHGSAHADRKGSSKRPRRDDLPRQVSEITLDNQVKLLRVLQGTK
jgi:two-component system response regulator GlrR